MIHQDIIDQFHARLTPPLKLKDEHDHPPATAEQIAFIRSVYKKIFALSDNDFIETWREFCYGSYLEGLSQVGWWTRAYYLKLIRLHCPAFQKQFTNRVAILFISPEMRATVDKKITIAQAKKQTPK